MREMDFRYQFKLLAQAFKEPEPDQDEMNRLYESYGKFPETVVGAACLELLKGTKYPTPAQIETAFRKASDRAGLTNSGSAPCGRFEPMDGMWNAKALSSNELTRFVYQLVKLRQTTEITPARVAEQIRQAGFESAFTDIGRWETMDRWELWGCAPTSSSAAATVKFCGRSPAGRWRGGEWVLWSDRTEESSGEKR